MRTIWLTAAAVMALAACSDSTDPAAKPGNPPVIATTNAKVEPVPTETVKPTGPVSPTTPPRAESDPCGANEVAPFVGRQDRPTTRADLARAVGHENIRWIGPDDVVTMDYSGERLNVLLDKAKRLITGARCG